MPTYNTQGSLPFGADPEQHLGRLHCLCNLCASKPEAGACPPWAKQAGQSDNPGSCAQRVDKGRLVGLLLTSPQVCALVLEAWIHAHGPEGGREGGPRLRTQASWCVAMPGLLQKLNTPSCPLSEILCPVFILR